MSVYLVIYTTEYDTIYRLVRNKKYSIGKYNSYGWYIVDLQILYCESFISMQHYSLILEQYYQRRISCRRKKEKILRILQILHDTFN